jgi:hypothetical protein
MWRLLLAFTGCCLAAAAVTEETGFSLENAERHVRTIASQPHPVGSPAHDAVQAYIENELTRIGLRPVLQEVDVVPGPRSRGITGATAEYPGASHGRSVRCATRADGDVRVSLRQRTRSARRL